MLSKAFIALLPETSGLLWSHSEHFWYYVGDFHSHRCNSKAFGAQLLNDSLSQTSDDKNGTNIPISNTLHTKEEPPQPIFFDPADPLGIANNEIATERKFWRAPVVNEYVEPDHSPDILDDFALIFKDYGKSLHCKQSKLPPRDDTILFDATSHQAEMDRNIRWHDCPQEYHPAFTQLIQEHWDIFAEEGLRHPVRGFVCRIDTGDVKPVCCKPPRYGPHESKVMMKLVNGLLDNGLVEPDEGPWGSPIVLATKAQHRDHTPWWMYEWRLCVSYRSLNRVTRPFTFPIPRCDDAVTDLPPDTCYSILTDMAAGYWQVLVEEASRGKLAFFTPEGKVRWTVMPMGFLNASSIFCAMMTTISKEWDEKAAEAGIDRCGAKIIMDNIFLWAYTVQILLNYFQMVLQTLTHYRATLKLKKTHFLPEKPTFVGVQIERDGNAPSESKYAVFRKIPPPATWSDLAMIIGMFGFYQQWLPLYEVRIQPWRSLQTQQPTKGELTVSEEEEQMKSLWKQEHTNLLEELKQKILEHVVLARPNYSMPFILKTDWSSHARGAVLCQPDPEHPDTPQLIDELRKSRKCPFDLSKSGPRLLPILFISCMSTKAERSHHSYVGEVGTGR